MCLYLGGLVGFDVRASDHERNLDVELVELPLVQRKRELTWRRKIQNFFKLYLWIWIWNHEPQNRNQSHSSLSTETWLTHVHVGVHACARTRVIPVVRGEEDVGVVQFTSDLQPLHYFLHQVVHWEQSSPPTGQDEEWHQTENLHLTVLRLFKIKWRHKNKARRWSEGLMWLTLCFIIMLYRDWPLTFDRKDEEMMKSKRTNDKAEEDKRKRKVRLTVSWRHRPETEPRSWTWGSSLVGSASVCPEQRRRALEQRHSHRTSLGDVGDTRADLPVDVEVGVPGSLGGVEAALVLRGRCPGRVGGRSGNHHEERLVVGFILEEVQRHVGLREKRTRNNP